MPLLCYEWVYAFLMAVTSTEMALVRSVVSLYLMCMIFGCMTLFCIF